MRRVVADLLAVLGVLVVAFVAPLLLVLRLRGLEDHRPEPWRRVVRAFVWGATGAILIAVVVETAFLDMPLAGLGAGIVSLVLVAPVVEEVAKALGLVFVRDEDPEPEDGFIYGGVAGLGFAATENVLYALTALSLGGIGASAATLVYRSVATVALHAAASAWAGYGLWQQRRTGLPGIFIPFLIGAVLLHALFNLLTSFGIVLSTLAAVGVAVLGYRRVEKRVRRLDAAAALEPAQV